MQVLKPDKTTRKRVKEQRVAAVKLLCSAAPIAGVRMSKFRDGQGLEKTEHDAQIELQVTYTSELVSCSRAMRAMCLRYTRVLCTRVCYISLLAMSPLQMCATGLEETQPLENGAFKSERRNHLRDLPWSWEGSNYATQYNRRLQEPVLDLRCAR